MHQTDNQLFHLILADIAMAAAIKSWNGGEVLAVATDYRPGALRDDWLERVTDPTLRQRVSALASAAMLPLQDLAADKLAETAGRYGIPLAPELAERIAQHFTDKRNAVLTYRR